MKIGFMRRERQTGMRRFRKLVPCWCFRGLKMRSRQRRNEVKCEYHRNL